MIALDSNWHTTEWLANSWGKSIRTVQYWAQCGYLLELGFKVCQMPSGNSRHGLRWFIHVPDEQPSDSLLAATPRLVDSPAHAASHSPTVS